MMAESLNLPWVGRASDGAVLHNIYIAAVPPRGIVRQMRDSWTRIGAGGEFRHLKLHMTVLGLVQAYDVDMRFVEQLHKAIGELTLPQFDVLFDQFLTFGAGREPRPQVFAPRVPGGELTALARTLGKVVPVRRRFSRSRLTPHVTASYGPALPRTFDLPSPIRWSVKEIMLVDNWVGLPRYDLLARWPLKPGGGDSPGGRPPQQPLLPGLFD